MQILIMEYRKTRRETKKKAKALKETIEKFETTVENETRKENPNKQEIQSLNEQIRVLKEDLHIVNSMISSLTFSIEWMATGKQPGSTRGIENRAGYERESCFESDWWQARFNESDHLFEKTDTQIHEELEEKERKEKIVKMIMKDLTKRQQEILILHSNSYTQQAIADVLNTTQQNISKALERIERLIKKKGWMLL